MPNTVRRILKTALYCFGILVFLISLLALLPMPDFEHHKARDLPWLLPDHNKAFSKVEILNNGQLHIQIEHLPLNNIEPKMVRFFYNVLPISTVELNGIHMPLYHIFHPTEHGYIEVKKAAPSGKPGMTVGAVIERREWFGDFNSKGSGRISEMTDNLMVAQAEMFGMNFGRIIHKFEATDYGTRYTIDSIIGSDLPVFGPIINVYIRNKMFPPNMITQWIRHQVQEVSSLQFFLKDLYQQKDMNKYHYILNID